MNGVAGYAGAVVNPMLALAVESTRQHLRNAAGLEALRNWPIENDLFPHWPGLADDRPEIDDAESLLRWQPDSRSSVLVFEALAGMCFEPLTGNGGELRVLHRDKDGKLAQSALATITRPKSEVLRQQAQRVADGAGERLRPKSDVIASRDRLTEINAQVVPPFAFWCAALPIHPDRMPRTIELIDLTLTLASFAVQRFKHALAVARPNQVNPSIFPAILTPAHGSLPSGHATEAFAVARVLYSLLRFKDGRLQLEPDKDGAPAVGGPLERMLMALAARIADNRQVAGLHYPIDTLAGRLLGTVLADYLVARCQKAGAKCASGSFDGAELTIMDPNVKPWIQIESRGQVAEPDPAGMNLLLGEDAACRLAGEAIEVPGSAALTWLWQKARKEWGSD